MGAPPTTMHIGYIYFAPYNKKVTTWHAQNWHVIATAGTKTRNGACACMHALNSKNPESMGIHNVNVCHRWTGSNTADIVMLVQYTMSCRF